MNAEEWSRETEVAAYTARAQAIVEAVVDYEQSHVPGSPCFEAPLRLMVEELQP